MTAAGERLTVGTRAKDLVVEASWRAKWRLDRRYLPLEPAHRALYEQLHRHCFRSIWRYPNLARPRDYTDKLQWLKLFDQDEAIVQCSDKIGVKDHVAKRVGPEHAAALLQVHDRFEDLDFDDLPDAFVIKTNHDSGTVVVVPDKDRLDGASVAGRIDRALATSYGWEKGEWAYSLVRPKVFVEELLGPVSGPALPDYKFHCVDGRVAWLQHIYDRHEIAKESLAERDGSPLPLDFSPNLVRGRPFRRPPEWEAMVEVAEEVAKGFKYVRVDLYVVDGRPYVGELTFFPLSGCYRGEGQRILGRRLTFDRTRAKPPLVSDRGVRIDRGRAARG